jgi:beta-glucosidase
MFCGETSPEWVIELVNTGKLTEERLNDSIRRILKDKFRLGLFNGPYVDVDNKAVLENDVFRKKVWKHRKSH